MSFLNSIFSFLDFIKGRNKKGESVLYNLNFVNSTVIFFGLLYVLISFVNHYQFRTCAWDLGINNNAIWDYSHFRWNNCMLIDGPQFDNILSDHLTIYPILVSPLIWIFGTYTLLVFQIISILYGGIGVRKLILLKSNDISLANISLVMFYSVWGIFSALSFDYHDNVVASMLVPWLFYYFFKDNYKRTLLFAVLILIGKENMALWLIFIGLGLLLQYNRSKTKIYLSLLISAIALAYFYFAITIIIPYFSNAGRGYLHFNYSALGRNFGEALFNILRNPLIPIKLLFTNPNNLTEMDEIKKELHLVFLLSGGIILFRYPAYLIMLIPIYAQKLFNDDFAKWGINYHYSIEFVPVLVVGVFDVLCDLKINNRLRLKVALFVALMAAFINVQKIDRRSSRWYSKDNLAFYQKRHYIQNFDISKVHSALKLIPNDATVKASSVLVPHLAFREVIYQYPAGPETDYIILLDNYNYFPLTKRTIKENIATLMKSNLWETIYSENSLYIFKRKS